MDSLIALKSLARGKRPNLTPETILGGKYVLKAPAGRGGMGEVWRAWDLVGARFVALKFISTDVKRPTFETQRMLETFHTVGELNHQNICPNYGLEFDKKYGLYLAMKWLGGYSLDKVIEHNRNRLGRFPRRAIPELLKPVALALDYSHSKGVIHRDVKPSNIFLEIRNRKISEVYLIDFGLSAIIRESAELGFSGTVLYMPPEQWLGANQNARTDQYSLAAIAYELYAGAPPFARSSFETLRSMALYEEPDRIKNLPDGVNAVLRRGLAKSMKERFETCGDFVDALAAAAESIEYDASEKAEILKPQIKLQLDDIDDVGKKPTQDSEDASKPRIGEKIAIRLGIIRNALQGDRSRLLLIVVVLLVILTGILGLSAVLVKLAHTVASS